MPKESQDPIERKRRELLEKQKQLSSQASSISESINKPTDTERDPQAPPVWKDDPDEDLSPSRDPSGAEKRLSAHKRRQDMLFFFLTLLVLAGVSYGLYYLIPIYLLPHANVLSQFTHSIGGS